jgi:hypothetical protein
VNATILIPEWAFQGKGTAYICLLDINGTAIAPQSAVNFQLEGNVSLLSLNLFSAPEYAWGALIAFVAASAAFIAFRMRKNGDTLT